MHLRVGCEKNKGGRYSECGRFMYSVEFTKVRSLNEGPFVREISPPLQSRCKAHKLVFLGKSGGWSCRVWSPGQHCYHLVKIQK